MKILRELKVEKDVPIGQIRTEVQTTIDILNEMIEHNKTVFAKSVPSSKDWAYTVHSSPMTYFVHAQLRDYTHEITHHGLLTYYKPYNSTAAPVYTEKNTDEDTYHYQKTISWWFDASLDQCRKKDTLIKFVVYHQNLLKRLYKPDYTLQPGDMWFDIRLDKTDVRHRSAQYKDGIHRVVVHGIPDCKVCEYCHKIVSLDKLDAHLQDTRCKRSQKHKSLGESEHVIAYKGSALRNLAIKGKVKNSKLVPTDYDVFVPKYLYDAAVLFEKNKNKGNKYMGLTLEEFLDGTQLTEDDTNETVGAESEHTEAQDTTDAPPGTI